MTSFRRDPASLKEENRFWPNEPQMFLELREICDEEPDLRGIHDDVLGLISNYWVDLEGKNKNESYKMLHPFHVRDYLHSFRISYTLISFAFYLFGMFFFKSYQISGSVSALHFIPGTDYYETDISKMEFLPTGEPKQCRNVTFGWFVATPKCPCLDHVQCRKCAQHEDCGPDRYCDTEGQCWPCEWCNAKSPAVGNVCPTCPDTTVYSFSYLGPRCVSGWTVGEPTKSFDDCSSECFTDPSCRFFGYIYFGQLCQLYSEEIPSEDCENPAEHIWEKGCTDMVRYELSDIEALGKYDVCDSVDKRWHCEALCYVFNACIAFYWSPTSLECCLWHSKNDTEEFADKELIDTYWGDPEKNVDTENGCYYVKEDCPLMPGYETFTDLGKVGGDCSETDFYFCEELCTSGARGDCYAFDWVFGHCCLWYEVLQLEDLALSYETAGVCTFIKNETVVPSIEEYDYTEGAIVSLTTGDLTCHEEMKEKPEQGDYQNTVMCAEECDTHGQGHKRNYLAWAHLYCVLSGFPEAVDFKVYAPGSDFMRENLLFVLFGNSILLLAPVFIWVYMVMKDKSFHEIKCERMCLLSIILLFEMITSAVFSISIIQYWIFGVAFFLLFPFIIICWSRCRLGVPAHVDLVTSTGYLKQSYAKRSDVVNISINSGSVSVTKLVVLWHSRGSRTGSSHRQLRTEMFRIKLGHSIVHIERTNEVCEMIYRRLPALAFHKSVVTRRCPYVWDVKIS